MTLFVYRDAIELVVNLYSECKLKSLNDVYQLFYFLLSFEIQAKGHCVVIDAWTHKTLSLRSSLRKSSVTTTWYYFFCWLSLIFHSRSILFEAYVFDAAFKPTTIARLRKVLAFPNNQLHNHVESSTPPLPLPRIQTFLNPWKIQKNQCESRLWFQKRKSFICCTSRTWRSHLDHPGYIENVKRSLCSGCGTKQLALFIQVLNMVSFEHKLLPTASSFAVARRKALLKQEV